MGRICRGGNGRSSLRPLCLHKPSLPPVIEQSFILRTQDPSLIISAALLLQPFSLSQVLHAPPTSISPFKRFPRLEGSQCTGSAFRSLHHGVTLSMMRRWVHMSLRCIQMFNVADLQTPPSLSLQKMSLVLPHKLHFHQGRRRRARARWSQVAGSLSR